MSQAWYLVLISSLTFSDKPLKLLNIDFGKRPKSFDIFSDVSSRNDEIKFQNVFSGYGVK